jgi:Xaa-Pro aminopeptidase
MRQRNDIVFPMAEFERRLTELRRRMGVKGIDAMLVTTPQNITYLTGYQTTGYYYFQAIVVPLEGEPFMVIRRLEDSNVQTRTWVEQSRPYEDTDEPVAKLVKALDEFGLGQKRIGYERNCYFFRAPEQERLLALAGKASFVDCSGLVEQGRVVKSEAEIRLMRRAARTLEAGMQAGLDATKPGASENDIAAAVHYATFRAGGEYTAVAPFVCSGPRTSIGHATWEGRTVGRNEPVFLELGSSIQRYHVAMMRSIWVGDPTPDIQEAEKVLSEAIEATMASMKSGVPASRPDAVNRAMVEKNSFGGRQTTRSGYSIGIAYAPDWGEGQILSLQANEERPLQDNMVFHVIPYLVVPGKACFGMSETVRVTPSGGEALVNYERRIFLR